MLPKTPRFWFRKTGGFCASLLAPVSWMYQIGHRVNQRTQIRRQTKLSIPVICVGSALIGGSGKTPSVMALAKLLKQNSICHNPFILLRGYGGRLKTPTLVDLAKHTPCDVGDEALLHARHHPTIIACDRAAGGQLAERLDADIILMDDGLQNQTLYKDLQLLCLDTAQGIGNGKTMPAGPLREPLGEALTRADGIICLSTQSKDCPIQTDKPVFSGKILPDNTPLETFKNQKVIAFAGLGRPEKFKELLHTHQINVIDFHPFPDHHPYTKEDLEKLTTQATKEDAILLTTEKDMIRLSKQWQEKINALQISLVFERENDLLHWIKKTIT